MLDNWIGDLGRLPYAQKGLELQSIEILTVVDADEMDDATFRLHFSRRHAEQLGGLSELPDDMDEETTELYRKFHDRLHKLLAMEIAHNHRD